MFDARRGTRSIRMLIYEHPKSELAFSKILCSAGVQLEGLGLM